MSMSNSIPAHTKEFDGPDGYEGHEGYEDSEGFTRCENCEENLPEMSSTDLIAMIDEHLRALTSKGPSKRSLP